MSGGRGKNDIDSFFRHEAAPAMLLNADGRLAFFITGYHAGNAIPRALRNLGLDAADRARHNAWDIGVQGLWSALLAGHAGAEICAIRRDGSWKGRARLLRWPIGGSQGQHDRRPGAAPCTAGAVMYAGAVSLCQRLDQSRPQAGSANGAIDRETRAVIFDRELDGVRLDLPEDHADLAILRRAVGIFTSVAHPLVSDHAERNRFVRAYLDGMRIDADFAPPRTG